MTSMPGAPFTEALPPATAQQIQLAQQLQDHVTHISSSIGPRHVEIPGSLELTANYISEAFSDAGLTPQEQVYGAEGFRIISATLPGESDEVLILGAHYDSARTGTPGADDNASGVAVLLELANLLANQRLHHSIRFVAFPNEERPYFNTELMGSRVDALTARQNSEKIIGMFSLEMLGYYDDEPGSQQYPPVIRNFYPDQGNFIALVSNMSSRKFLHGAIEAFRAESIFPSAGMAAPEALVGDIRRSDNSAYSDQGFPAIMVTDTSNFRTPYYHSLEDTPDTLNFDYMARVTQGLSGMVITLANTVE